MLYCYTGKGWPLNHHFIFDITAVTSFFIILLSFALPRASEKKRLPEPATNSVLVVDDDNTSTSTSDDSVSMINMVNVVNR